MTCGPVGHRFEGERFTGKFSGSGIESLFAVSKKQVEKIAQAKHEKWNDEHRLRDV